MDPTSSPVARMFSSLAPSLPPEIVSGIVDAFIYPADSLHRSNDVFDSTYRTGILSYRQWSLCAASRVCRYCCNRIRPHIFARIILRSIADVRHLLHLLRDPRCTVLPRCLRHLAFHNFDGGAKLSDLSSLPPPLPLAPRALLSRRCTPAACARASARYPTRVDVRLSRGDGLRAARARVHSLL